MKNSEVAMIVWLEKLKVLSEISEMKFDVSFYCSYELEVRGKLLRVSKLRNCYLKLMENPDYDYQMTEMDQLFNKPVMPV